MTPLPTSIPASVITWKAGASPIGPYDLQIAAIALANGCTLVTHNTTEFSRVPGLVLQDGEMP